jgi:hypothetical protein
VRQIVERPADRHLDEWRRHAEMHRLLRVDDVAGASAVRQVVMRHHAAVVEKTVLQHQLDGTLAEVPGRRTVPAGLPAGQPLDRGVSAREDRVLLVAGEFSWRLVHVTMMRDLVIRCVHGRTGVGIRCECVRRDEPG